MDQAEMNPADLTLDELRLALAPSIADAAVFDGWTDEALTMAADQMGADVDVARLAFKGKGGGVSAMDMAGGGVIVF